MLNWHIAYERDSRLRLGGIFPEITSSIDAKLTGSGALAATFSSNLRQSSLV